MKSKLFDLVSWLFLIVLAVASFKAVERERDMYKAYYEINMLREGYKAKLCTDYKLTNNKRK